MPCEHANALRVNWPVLKAPGRQLTRNFQARSGMTERVRYVAFSCTLVHRRGRPPFPSGRYGTCTTQFWVISQLARIRIGDSLDYSIARGPESMPPTCVVPEIRTLAPDHTGGSASDDSLGPP